MSFTIYDATVVTFIRDLDSMKKFLKKGETWCDEQGKPHSYLLERSLAPDMLLLPFQIWTVCKYAVFTLTKVGTAEDPKIEDTQKTFAELYDRIDKTIALLKSAKREDFNDVDKPVKIQIPNQELSFTAKTYVQRMVLPNFYFHQTAAYLILRNAGVPLGKADFLDAKTITAP